MGQVAAGPGSFLLSEGLTVRLRAGVAPSGFSAMASRVVLSGGQYPERRPLRSAHAADRHTQRGMREHLASDEILRRDDDFLPMEKAEHAS